MSAFWISSSLASVGVRAPGVRGREAPDVGSDDGLKLVVQDVGLDVGLDVDGRGSLLSSSLSASKMTVGVRDMV